MGVPHTRPTSVTAHATRAELVAGRDAWVGTVQVPGAMTNLVEYRLGQLGHDAMGFAVHVPHYLAQADYPAAAAALLENVAAVTELTLPTGPLHDAAASTRGELDEQRWCTRWRSSTTPTWPPAAGTPPGTSRPCWPGARASRRPTSSAPSWSASWPTTAGTRRRTADRAGARPTMSPRPSRREA
jgi:hypothetical protein